MYISLYIYMERERERERYRLINWRPKMRGTFFALELKPLISSLPLSTPMALIRTWSNGWFTSVRMHEPIALPCIFGCDAGDTLHHYLKCDVLWTLIYCCTNCKTSAFRQTIEHTIRHRASATMWSASGGLAVQGRSC